MRDKNKLLDFRKFFEKLSSSDSKQNENSAEDPGKPKGDNIISPTNKKPKGGFNPNLKEPVNKKSQNQKNSQFSDVGKLDAETTKKQPWYNIYLKKIQRYGSNPGENTRARVKRESAFLFKNPKASHYLIIKNNKRVFGVDIGSKIKLVPNENFPKGEEIEKNICKKFGEKVKIEDLQKYYYYINEWETGKFRIIKFLEQDKQEGKLIVTLSDKKILKETIDNFGDFYKLDPEEKDEESSKDPQDQGDEGKLPDDLQSILDKVNGAQNTEELPFKEIKDLFEKYKDIEEGEIEIIDEEEKEKKVNISTSIIELGKVLDVLKSGTEKKESMNTFNSKNYNKIFEAGGMGSKSTGSSKPTLPKVRERFEKTFESIEKIENLSLTQNEVDEMNELLSSGTLNYTLDVSARPDPVVNIVSVFTDAHELYYTDPIPSGRPGGRVSNNTFRQYLKLGKGGSREGKPEDPSGSVYAVKTIFNDWKRGVRGILKDPAYAMISKIKFKIPGKEQSEREKGAKVSSTNDSYLYNYPQNYRIFEEADETKKLISTNGGKALIEFMIKATNPKNLDDFENLCDDLLLGNFGIEKGKWSDKVIPSKKSYNTTPDVDDIDVKNLKFCGVKKNTTEVMKFIKGDLKPGNLLMMSFKCKDGGSDKNYIFCGKVKDKKDDKKIQFDEVFFFQDKLQDIVEFVNEYKAKNFSLDEVSAKSLNASDTFGTTSVNSKTKFKGDFEIDTSSSPNKLKIDFENTGDPSKKIEVEIETKLFNLSGSIGEVNTFLYVLQQPDTGNKYKNFVLS